MQYIEIFISSIYEKLCLKRCKHFFNQKGGHTSNVEKKKVIEKLYFKEKKTLTEIGEELKLSVSYVTKILKQNEMYSIEKEKRKQENLAKRRAKQKESIYEKRRLEKKSDSSYLVLKNEHEQAAKELSKRTTIGTETLRQWCSSAYKYNPSKRRYEFDAGNSVRSVDLPKYIKV